MSVLFIVLLLLARWLLIRLIRHGAHILSENQRKWISQVKNGFFIALLLGIAFAWLPELETFALSITAVAVALVIATKELILCLSGTVYRASTNLFQVGDWIEVGPHFGEVVEQSILSTLLQEVDRKEFVFAGQTVAMPNSMLLTHPVINHSLQKSYIFHSFELTTEPDANPFQAIELLSKLIEELISDFSEAAKQHNAVIEKRSGIDIPGPETRFGVRTTDIAKTVLTITIFCPIDRASSLQFDITCAYFDWYFENRIKMPA